MSVNKYVKGNEFNNLLNLANNISRDLENLLGKRLKLEENFNSICDEFIFNFERVSEYKKKKFRSIGSDMEFIAQMERKKSEMLANQHLINNYYHKSTKDIKDARQLRTMVFINIRWMNSFIVDAVGCFNLQKEYLNNLKNTFESGANLFDIEKERMDSLLKNSIKKVERITEDNYKKINVAIENISRMIEHAKKDLNYLDDLILDLKQMRERSGMLKTEIEHGNFRLTQTSALTVKPQNDGYRILQ